MTSRRRAVASAFAAVAAALVLAACGSNEKAQPSTQATTVTTTATGLPTAAQKEWAGRLCGALGLWKRSLASLTSIVSGGGASRAKLERAARTVSNANAKLLASVQSLGTPPGLTNPKAKAAVAGLSGRLKRSADKIDRAAKGASSAQGAQKAATVATSAVLAMSTDISSTLNELEGLHVSKAWRQAFAGSPTCRALSS
jgi:hypothetical protein